MRSLVFLEATGAVSTISSFTKAFSLAEVPIIAILDLGRV